MPKGHPIIKTNSKGEVPISPFDIQNFKKFYEGTIFTNFYGDRYIILKYFNAGSVLIEFLDEFHYRTNTKLSVIKTGNVKNPFHKGKFGQYVGAGLYNRKNDHPVYNVWIHMHSRVYESKTEYYSIVDSYKYCTICNEWYCFQNFASWYYNYISKLNPNYKYSIDKDIFQFNIKNKIYSPTTCCIVPEDMNNMLSGIYPKIQTVSKNVPTGVVYNCGKFYPNLVIKQNHVTNLGHYDTPMEAFEVYKYHKLDYIHKCANLYYKDGAILKDVYDQLYSIDILPYMKFIDE